MKIESMKMLSDQTIQNFQKTIYEFYAQHQRQFSWRENITPYKILVSEIMLQQTQTSRVISKFATWIEKFPNFHSLAQASTHDVLTAWQGLGYNRRGLALLKIAQLVVEEHNGILPDEPNILQTFPAIGPNTAGSICAFAFNKPTLFIETNIRTVYTHTFFPNQVEISDKQLLPLIQATIDHNNARYWYYALMDYGVHLKKHVSNINSASKHYTKQSRFEGSKRQVRGTILKILTQLKTIAWDDLRELLHLELPYNEHDKDAIIKSLIQENIIYVDNNILHL